GGGGGGGPGVPSGGTPPGGGARGGVGPAAGMETTVGWSCTDGGCVPAGPPAAGGVPGMCCPGPVDAPLSSEVLCSGGAQGSLPPAGLPPGCVASVILGCPPWSIVRPCYGAARRGPPGGHRR